MGSQTLLEIRPSPACPAGEGAGLSSFLLDPCRLDRQGSSLPPSLILETCATLISAATAADLHVLRGLERPIYAIARAGGPPPGPPEVLVRIYANPEVAIYVLSAASALPRAAAVRFTRRQDTRCTETSRSAS